jgi:hypothetical protein
MNPRRQGDLGEYAAIEWLGSRGYPVWYPLGHSPDCDLITEIDSRLLRVQVKTSTYLYNGRFGVTLATRGGNQNWSGLVKRFSSERCDWLFVLVADGRRWTRRLIATLADRPAGFRSGQTGRTVNPLAQPSQVRILPPP